MLQHAIMIALGLGFIEILTLVAAAAVLMLATAPLKSPPQ
jgi:hypothetical protein